ncbi:MAG TPA: DoxX family membrane protein [Pyrinomonadaceae bacterium]
MKIIKRITKWIFAVSFVLAGVNHFVNPDFYLRMMPPFLPAPLFLIYLSGFFQISLGVLLLVPRFSRRAAYGLIALLIAVFPANIYMAANPHLFAEFSLAALYARLPLQLLFIVWAFWIAKNEN